MKLLTKSDWNHFLFKDMESKSSKHTYTHTRTVFCTCSAWFSLQLTKDLASSHLFMHTPGKQHKWTKSIRHRGGKEKKTKQDAQVLIPLDMLSSSHNKRTSITWVREPVCWDIRGWKCHFSLGAAQQKWGTDKVVTKRREGLPDKGNSICKSSEEPSPSPGEPLREVSRPVCPGLCDGSWGVRQGSGGEMPLDAGKLGCQGRARW